MTIWLKLLCVSLLNEGYTMNTEYKVRTKCGMILYTNASCISEALERVARQYKVKPVSIVRT